MFHQFASAEPKAKPKKKKQGPKRPLTAYQYFLKDIGPLMPASLTFEFRSKAAAAIWKGMSVEDKAKFEALAQKDRERYWREKAAASAGAGSSSSSSSSAAAAPADNDEPQYTGGLTLQAALDKRQAEAEAKGEVVDLTNDDAAASSASSSTAAVVAFRKGKIYRKGDIQFRIISTKSIKPKGKPWQRSARVYRLDTRRHHRLKGYRRRVCSGYYEESVQIHIKQVGPMKRPVQTITLLPYVSSDYIEITAEDEDQAAASSSSSAAAAASSSTVTKRKVYYVQRFFKNGDPTDEFLKQELDPVELVQNKKLMPTSKKVRSKERVPYWTPHIQKDFEDGQGFPSKYYVTSGWSDADGYHVLASGDAFKGINDPNKLLKQLLRNFSSGFGPYVEDDPWMGHQEFPIHNEMIIILKQVCKHLKPEARRILFDPNIIEGKNLIHPVVWIEGPPLEKEDEDQAAASSSSSSSSAAASSAGQ